MVQFKWIARVTAGQVFARMFVRTLPIETWAPSGDVTLLHEEWLVLAATIVQTHYIVVKDPKGFLA